MSALDRLLGRQSEEGPPDLAVLVGADEGARVVVVNGGPAYGDGGVEAAFPSATWVAQRDETGHTLPFREGDPSALDAPAGGWDMVVVLDVLDRVLDPAHALRAAGESLSPGGRVLVVQRVAPDDFSDRAAWNVLARLADTAQTWTANRRQTRAVAGGAGLKRGAEAVWEEWIPLAAPRRGETAGLHDLFAASLAGGEVVRDGRLVVRRLAVVLERR